MSTTSLVGAEPHTIKSSFPFVKVGKVMNRLHTLPNITVPFSFGVTYGNL